MTGNREGTMARFMNTMVGALVLTTPALAADDWHPSKYGAGDTKGATNNLSAEATLKATKLVKTGKVYALGVVTGPNSPAYPGRSFSAAVMAIDDGGGAGVGKEKVTGHDDVLMTFVGIGTQLDGFAHIGIDHVHYNGVHSREFYRPDGVTKYGTQDIVPVATRGVLLDMAKLMKQSPVKPGTAFNRAEIDAAAKAAGVTIGKGDVVLFHTGWLATAKDDPKQFIAVQPGLGREGAEYLASLGVVMIGADTAALEVIPFQDPASPFIVHATLLAKHGVHILETVNTAALAADGATEFLFVLGQPRFQGTVQAVVNPIAIR
jgi:kynurenine formamidase